MQHNYDTRIVVTFLALMITLPSLAQIPAYDESNSETDGYRDPESKGWLQTGPECQGNGRAVYRFRQHRARPLRHTLLPGRHHVGRAATVLGAQCEAAGRRPGPEPEAPWLSRAGVQEQKYWLQLVS